MFGVWYSPEGGGGAASLAVTGSKEASLAASCGAQQQNSLDKYSNIHNIDNTTKVSPLCS